MLEVKERQREKERERGERKGEKRKRERIITEIDNMEYATNVEIQMFARIQIASEIHIFHL